MYIYIYISAGPLVGHTAVKLLAVYSQCPQSQVSRQCLAVTVQCTVPLLKWFPAKPGTPKTPPTFRSNFPF